MITALGISVIDHIMVIDGFNHDDGSFFCEYYTVESGGMAATALCAASKLGARTRLLTRIGDDINGQFIVDGLKRFGVDTSGVIYIKGKHSTVSIVLVDANTGEYWNPLK